MLRGKVEVRCFVLVEVNLECLIILIFSYFFSFIFGLFFVVFITHGCCVSRVQSPK